MKITDMKTTWVSVPIEKPMLGTTGVHPGRFSRTLVELYTDEGIVGLGEVGGGDQRAALERLKPRLIGESPFDLERIRQRTLRQVYYGGQDALYIDHHEVNHPGNNCQFLLEMVPDNRYPVTHEHLVRRTAYAAEIDPLCTCFLCFFSQVLQCY